MRDQRRESAAVQHFGALTANRTKREVLKLLKQWQEVNGHHFNIRRNISRFITGSGREVSDELNPYLLAFCREGLRIEVEDNEFDKKDRRRDLGAEFARENTNYRSTLEDLCGEYTLFRPRLIKSRIDRARDDGLGYEPWDAEIAFGPAESFKFELLLEKRCWSGSAYCSAGIIYLFAAETNKQNIVSAILAPFGQIQDGLLVGTMLMSVGYVEENPKVSHSLAAARPVAMAHKGRGKQKREAVASKWLDEQVASGAGFCIRLRETAPSSPYEGR